MWPQVGFEPMPLIFQMSLLTTRPLTPPLSWCPQSKGLCKTRPQTLTLLATTAVIYIYTSAHLSSVQWRHPPPANNFSDAYIHLNNKNIIIFSKHPIAKERCGPRWGFKAMPLTFWASTLTTRH